MLAKVISNRSINRPDPEHFRARVDYICGKATQVALINLAGDWRDPRKQMAAAATLAPRLRSPAYHLVLSWAETESPTDAEMIMAATALLIDIGAAPYQCVLATHRDRIDPHIHIVVNRAHPTGGRALSLSHDYAWLEAACRRVEHRMGWPQDRGRFDMRSEGAEVMLVPKPVGHWRNRSEARAAGLRKAGQGARDELRGSRRPSLRESLTNKAVAWLRGALAQATDWVAAQKACRSIGLRYVRHGAGARIMRSEDGTHMPANRLGTEYSYIKMTARLGPFHEPAVEQRGVDIRDAAAAATDSLAILSPPCPEPLQQGLQSNKQQDPTILRETLRRQRVQVTALLRSRRSFAVQATRMVLKERERMVRDMHRTRQKAAKSAIQPEAPPIGEQIRIAMPDRDKGFHDHTSARQTWILSSTTERREQDIIFSEALLSNPEVIRIAPGRRALLAHRNIRGSLVGVQQFDLATGQDLGIALGGRAALCAFRRKGAKMCILTPDVRVALQAASELRHRADIWLVKQGLRPGEVKLLQEAVRDLRTGILHLPDSDPDDLAALSQMFASMAVIRIADNTPLDLSGPSELSLGL